jgi:hypothetical protein
VADRHQSWHLKRRVCKPNGAPEETKEQRIAIAKRCLQESVNRSFIVVTLDSAEIVEDSGKSRSYRYEKLFLDLAPATPLITKML